MAAAGQPINDHLAFLEDTLIIGSAQAQDPSCLTDVKRAILEKGNATGRVQPLGDDLNAISHSVAIEIRQAQDASSTTLCPWLSSTAVVTRTSDIVFFFPMDFPIILQ